LFELSALYNLNKHLNLITNQEELFEQSEHFLKDYLHIDNFCFLLADDYCNTLQVVKASNDNYRIIHEAAIKQGEDVFGATVRTGETVLVEDVSKDELFLPYVGKIAGTGSFISIPLKSHNNRITGILGIHVDETNAFQEEDTIFFSVIAQNISYALERVRLSEKLPKEFMFDDLTDLFTKSYFLKNSQREFINAKRYSKYFSIVLAEIDHFKQFNERHGQLRGDEVLKKLAFILKASLRYGDIVCRYSKEEFAILLPETDKDDAILTSEKLRSSVEKMLTIKNTEGEQEKITITVGTVAYPEDGKTLEEILTTAESFVSFGKKSGSNRVVYTAPYDISYTTNKKYHINKSTRSVLSDEEIYALLYKSVKRTMDRHKVALMVSHAINHLQLVEIKINDNDWKMCTLVDISKTGFKGEIDSKVKIDDIYSCNAIMDSEIRIPDFFSIRIAYTKPIHHNRCQIGAEIISGNDHWERLITLMSN
jgi:diguanylate cyclase (GGDEF)-like protein